MKDYNVGDVICVRTSMGTFRIVLVEEKLADIKNGEPGFSGVCMPPGGAAVVWGYDFQVLHVVKKAEPAKAKKKTSKRSV